jgi:beta-lactam-binding protein with PASTA domain
VAQKSLITRFLWLMPFAAFLAGYWCMRIWYPPIIIETPSLLGKTVQEAMRIVADSNINLRLLEEREVQDLPEGTILQQNPPAKIPIKEYQSIFCVVSKKGERSIPSLIGKSMTEAVQILDSKGIAYKQYSVESNQPEGTCIAQDPAVGMPANQNPMTLYGAKSYPKQVIVPSFLYMTVGMVRQFLESSQVTSEVIHKEPVESTHQCDQQCIISDQRPCAGTIVVLDDKKPLHVQLLVSK